MDSRLLWGGSFRRLRHETPDLIPTAGQVDAGIEHAGDVRVVHECKRLLLRLEASDESARVHAWFDDLEGHAAPHRLLLFGHEHEPHPSLADLFHQTVGTNDRAGPFSPRRLIDGSGESGSRGFEEAPGVEMGLQKPLHSLEQFTVGTADSAEIRRALGMRLDLDCGTKDRIKARCRCGHCVPRNAYW
jgi:hypothetical protein